MENTILLTLPGRKVAFPHNLTSTKDSLLNEHFSTVLYGTSVQILLWPEDPRLDLCRIVLGTSADMILLYRWMNLF
jgi:hypothetical protein